MIFLFLFGGICDHSPESNYSLIQLGNIFTSTSENVYNHEQLIYHLSQQVFDIPLHASNYIGYMVII